MILIRNQPVRFCKPANAHLAHSVAARDLIQAVDTWAVGTYIRPGLATGIALVRWMHYTLPVDVRNIRTISAGYRSDLFAGDALPVAEDAADARMGEWLGDAAQ